MKLDEASPMRRRRERYDPALLAAECRGPLIAWLSRHYPAVTNKEDIVQDSLVKCQNKCMVWDRQAGKLPPYLVQTVKNKALDELRKATREREHVVPQGLVDERDSVADDNDPAKAHADKARLQALLRLLRARLSRRACRCVISVVLRDRSIRETAKMLDMSERRVSYAVNRSLTKLKGPIREFMRRYR
jgi:RNA polymerase sigma factor (sigma-70 family)